VKWFVPEEDSEQAKQLKRDYENGETDITSPQLILFEVANALRYHPVVRLNEVDLVTAVESLKDLAIIVEMDRTNWVKTFELSRTEGISIYDAAYLSLAELNGAKFVTADRRFHDGLSAALKHRVLLLSTLED